MVQLLDRLTYTPQFTLPNDRGFGAGLFSVQSPLLGESLLFSFPPLSNMLKFSGCSRLNRSRNNKRTLHMQLHRQIVISYWTRRSVRARRTFFGTVAACAQYCPFGADRRARSSADGAAPACFSDRYRSSRGRAWAQQSDRRLTLCLAPSSNSGRQSAARHIGIVPNTFKTDLRSGVATRIIPLPQCAFKMPMLNVSAIRIE